MDGVSWKALLIKFVGGTSKDEDLHNAVAEGF